mmetsp:Transcript_9000/g.33191  ORF Transcript_9000/g.33191 Transcript_9000/m.33191 type:complete len:171 (-) Transcript_9000:83-595(-)
MPKYILNALFIRPISIFKRVEIPSHFTTIQVEQSSAVPLSAYIAERNGAIFGMDVIHGLDWSLMHQWFFPSGKSSSRGNDHSRADAFPINRPDNSTFQYAKSLAKYRLQRAAHSSGSNYVNNVRYEVKIQRWGWLWRCVVYARGDGLKMTDIPSGGELARRSEPTRMASQ